MRRAILAFSLAACSANDDMPAPHIAAVSPDHATAATSVLITGTNFCHQAATEDPLACDVVGQVQFGSSAATAAQYADTSITVDVPNGTGGVDVRVEVAGEVSNAVRFTFE